MNILDENILNDQCQLLQKWGIRFRRIGSDAGRKGMKDDEIISFLPTIRRPTFFTLDRDFFASGLCHDRYSIVFLDVEQSEAASFVRRFLRHPEFKTNGKRMGRVIKVSHAGISSWKLHAEMVAFFTWKD